VVIRKICKIRVPIICQINYVLLLTPSKKITIFFYCRWGFAVNEDFE